MKAFLKKYGVRIGIGVVILLVLVYGYSKLTQHGPILPSPKEDVSAAKESEDSNWKNLKINGDARMLDDFSNFAVPVGVYRVSGTNDDFRFTLNVHKIDLVEVDPSDPTQVIEDTLDTTWNRLKVQGDVLGEELKQLKIPSGNYTVEGDNGLYAYILEVRQRVFVDANTITDSLTATRKLKSWSRGTIGEEWFPATDRRIDELEDGMGQLSNRVDGIESRVTDLEIRIDRGFTEISDQIGQLTSNLTATGAIKSGT